MDGDIDVSLGTEDERELTQVSATSDGMGVAAYLAADGRICAYLVDQQGKLPDECGDPAQRVHLLRNRAGQPWMMFGTMPPEAQWLQAKVPGYESTSGTHDVDPGLYTLAVVGEPETLDFLTSEGTVVETVPLTEL